MGLGFNLCVAHTLTFCPCILGGGMNWGLGGNEREGGLELGCDMQFQTGELEYMIQGFIWKSKNRTEHGPGIRDQG